MTVRFLFGFNFPFFKNEKVEIWVDLYLSKKSAWKKPKSKENRKKFSASVVFENNLATMSTLGKCDTRLNLPDLLSFKIIYCSFRLNDTVVFFLIPERSIGLILIWKYRVQQNKPYTFINWWFTTVLNDFFAKFIWSSLVVAYKNQMKFYLLGGLQNIGRGTK